MAWTPAENGYILLATSADGSLATIAMPTPVRVVCNNTLSMALAGASNLVKVPHSTTFDAASVKGRLGIAVSGWDDFMYRMKKLSELKVKNLEVERFVLKVLCDMDGASPAATVTPNERGLKRVQELFDGRGRGSGTRLGERYRLGFGERGYRLRRSRATGSQSRVQAR